jgi:predicted HTH domain antitoxin
MAHQGSRGTSPERETIPIRPDLWIVRHKGGGGQDPACAYNATALGGQENHDGQYYQLGVVRGRTKGGCASRQVSVSGRSRWTRFRGPLVANPPLRLNTAVELYRRNRVTLSRSAEIAGLEVETFKTRLVEHGISIPVDESPEEVSAGAELIHRLRQAP